MILNFWWDTDIISIKVNYYKNSKKYFMISNIQRMFIIHDYKNKKSFKEIMNKYKVSMSSIFKIIKDYKINKYSNLKIDWNLSENTNFTANEKEFLREYIQPPQKPLTIWRINNELNNHFEVKDRKREIKLFLKNELCYSYKKGESTTLKGGSERTKLLQSIFSSRILLKIHKDNIIVNIDEWSF